MLKIQESVFPLHSECPLEVWQPLPNWQYQITSFVILFGVWWQIPCGITSWLRGSSEKQRSSSCYCHPFVCRAESEMTGAVLRIDPVPTTVYLNQALSITTPNSRLSWGQTSIHGPISHSMENQVMWHTELPLHGLEEGRFPKERVCVGKRWLASLRQRHSFILPWTAPSTPQHLSVTSSEVNMQRQQLGALP